MKLHKQSIAQTIFRGDCDCSDILSIQLRKSDNIANRKRIIRIWLRRIFMGSPQFCQVGKGNKKILIHCGSLGTFVSFDNKYDIFDAYDTDEFLPCLIPRRSWSDNLDKYYPDKKLMIWSNFAWFLFKKHQLFSKLPNDIKFTIYGYMVAPN